MRGRGGEVWHKASILGCLPLAVPIGLSPLLILTLCGSERVLVVSTEPLDDLSCLTTPGSAVPETGCCRAVDQGRGGGGVAQSLGIRLFAFGGTYWPLATAHSDPLWARTCFGCVNGRGGGGQGKGEGAISARNPSARKATSQRDQNQAGTNVLETPHPPFFEPIAHGVEFKFNPL